MTAKELHKTLTQQLEEAVREIQEITARSQELEKKVLMLRGALQATELLVPAEKEQEVPASTPLTEAFE
jgi:regulator of protease activity HflC (stomatin/prohibitin superfamily)